MIRFYDTCALLLLQNKALEDDSMFYISNITLSELENIKTSGTRDEETKWQARQMLHLLEQNQDKYEIILHHLEFEEIITECGLPLNNDSKIISDAYNVYKVNQEASMPLEVKFYTVDLACKKIAEGIGLPCEYTLEVEDDPYTGYKEIILDDLALARFYNETLESSVNEYDLLPNQYLLIRYNGNITDKYVWKGDHYEPIPFTKAQSKMFGKIVPKDNDPYQQIALDSLAKNQITMLRGPAGSGKSFLAFGHMFSLLEAGKIDKIVVFCNTVATKGSAKLGFYPGSRTEKLMDSQIGNLLESKLGDRVAVERLIDDGELVLLPLSDIRGYDTTGLNAAIYISEAQNLDIELMRLALQRIGEDSICVIDGDDLAQVDLSMYAGSRNGMKRVSKIFRGHEFYGEVKLNKIHRSKIAELAQEL